MAAPPKQASTGTTGARPGAAPQSSPALKTLDAPKPASPEAQPAKGPSAAADPKAAPPEPLKGSQGQRVFTGRQPESKPLTLEGHAERTQGVQLQAAGAVMMLNLTRARLEDISDDDERDKAETWLVQNRPVIYQTLFENPGAGMVVQFHFERVEGRLRYNGATKDIVPDGNPPRTSTVDTLDITGTGVRLFFPPVRKPRATSIAKPDAQQAAGVKSRLIQSGGELIAALPNSANSLKSYYALREAAEGRGPMGPFGMHLGDNDVEVTATALDAALQLYKKRLESSLGDRHQRLKDSIEQSQKNLQAALTAHTNFASKWWFRKRIALLDPHVMDKPREHEAAAREALHRDDFRAAAASLKAGEDLVTYAEERLFQFREGIDRIEEHEL